MEGYTNFTKVFADEVKGTTIVGDLTGNSDTASLATAINKVTPKNAVASSLTTALEGNNNDLVFTARTKGVAGDNISIAYVDPEKETAEESVVVTGTDIVVTLRSVSSTLSTANQVIAAIEGNAEANALVTVAKANENTGEGVVTAMTADNLKNGADGTVGVKGQLVFDDSYIYVCTAANTIADTNWKKVSIS